ncbi:MAG: uncharacterized protein JWM06_373 [Actinomycetia bacterium]|nr:uncharacterized protein [Actinomycetes bacterium]
MTTLEQELADVLSSARLDGRQARVVSRRLGWDGHGPTTLAAAGGAEGYTRERVRQLEDRLKRHLATGETSLPITERALRIVEAAAPSPRPDLARMLTEEGISARPFDPAGVLTAAELGGLQVNVLELDGLVVSRDGAAIPDRAMSLARALVARHGATSVSELTRRLSGSGLSSASLRRLLEHRGEVTWLDSRREWFVVPSKSSRAGTGLRKMLSIARSLSLADVDEGLRRSARPVTLPRSILRSMCETFDWIAVDRRSDAVTATVPLDPARTLSPLERELIRIFRTDGPVLAFTRAVQLAAEAGINPTSAGLYLTRTPVLQTVARGRYAVRGAMAA